MSIHTQLTFTCSKLTINTPERRHWRHSRHFFRGCFFTNFIMNIGKEIAPCVTYSFIWCNFYETGDLKYYLLGNPQFRHKLNPRKADSPYYLSARLVAYFFLFLFAFSKFVSKLPNYFFSIFNRTLIKDEHWQIER